MGNADNESNMEKYDGGSIFFISFHFYLYKITLL